MHTTKRKRLGPSLRAWRGGGVVLLIGVCVLTFGGCPDPTEIVLSAQDGTADRQPPAGAVRVDLFNGSTWPAEVQVDYYIGNSLVHHAEAKLASINSSDANTQVSLDWDEADRVVIRAAVRSSRGKVIWTDEHTARLGTDFSDGATLSYTVIYPTGTAPVALISAPTSAGIGETITLDGSASFDPNNDALTFQWSQVAGQTVTLQNADTDKATFVAPTVSTSEMLVFRLTVSDGQTSATADHSIVIHAPSGQAPIAVVDAPASVSSNDLVTLDGSASHDPDGGTLTFTWEQISGVPVTFDPDTADTEQVTFVAPDVSVSETLIFRLTVEDPEGLTAFEEFDVTITPAH